MSSHDSPEPVPSPESAPAPERGAAEPDGDLRAARRTLVLFVLAVGAALAGFVMVLAGGRGDDGGSTIADAPDAVPGALGDVSIGPPPGESVERYVDNRRSALDEVEGRRVAVVSLTGYSTVETTIELLEGLDVERYLIAMVGDGPRTTRDVDGTRTDVVDVATEQLADIEEIAPTVEDDPDYSSFYAEEIERYRRLLDDADRDDVVFGVVVMATASELRSLASRASVRLVDIGAADRIERDATVRGLRPEETATVGEPRFRP